PKERLPLFELSLVLVAATIGWAEFNLYQIKSQTDRDREGFRQSAKMLERQATNWQQQVQIIRQDNQKMWEVLGGLRSKLVNELKQHQETKQDDELTLPDNHRLQEEYLAVADMVQTNIDQLQSALRTISQMQSAPSGNAPTGKSPGNGPEELTLFQRRRAE